MNLSYSLILLISQKVTHFYLLLPLTYTIAAKRATLGNILVDDLLLESDLHEAIFCQGVYYRDNLSTMDDDALKTSFYSICRPGGHIPNPNHVVGDTAHPALMNNPRTLAPTLHKECVKILM